MHDGISSEYKSTRKFMLMKNKYLNVYCISNSYTMVCRPVRGDNPRALPSGLSYVQVDKHGITI